MYQQKSLFYINADLYEYLNEMSQFLCSARIKRNVRTMTKNGEFGGDGSYWLPEVVITPSRPPTPPPPPPSLPPPPPPPTNPGMPTINPPIYPPGYVPPSSPPKTGGGSGSGGGQQYPLPKLKSPDPLYDKMTEQVNEVLILIYDILKDKEIGSIKIDLSKYKFAIATSCTVNARIEKNGSIGICNSFVNSGYNINDQSSIIWHEIYHILKDNAWSTDKWNLPSVIRFSDIPSDIENFIRNELYNGRISDKYYEDEITVSIIYSPGYYSNEINAYQAEKNNGIAVSPEYVREREFLLWRHQQYLKIAEQYYKK